MATQRWNTKTGTWERYTPAHRDYPRLSTTLAAQLQAIEPTDDGMMKYFPCMVLLANGQQHDCVYIADANSYIRIWGVWPEDDPGKKFIRMEDVEQIQPSPSRLPARFAREMYSTGESAMGYCIFTLHFADGTRQAYCTGNLIEFPELPEGKSAHDVVALSSNEGREEQSLGTRAYYWCLFGAQSQESLMQRLSHALRLS